MKIRKVTFVCTGNTCRSVLAEKIFEKLIEDTPLKNIEADSAGTDAVPYLSFVADLKEVLEENNIGYTGNLPKKIDGYIIRNSDLVLAMARRHKDELSWRFPQFKDKIFMLSEYAGNGEKDIIDPVGQGKDAYRKAFRDIHGYLMKIVEKLIDELKKER